jgi:hypothetical protein
VLAFFPLPHLLIYHPARTRTDISFTRRRCRRISLPRRQLARRGPDSSGPGRGDAAALALLFAARADNCASARGLPRVFLFLLFPIFWRPVYIRVPSACHVMSFSVLIMCSSPSIHLSIQARSCLGYDFCARSARRVGKPKGQMCYAVGAQSLSGW